MLYENSPLNYVTLTAQDSIVDINPSGLKLFGLERGGLISIPLFQVFKR